LLSTVNKDLTPVADQEGVINFAYNLQPADAAIAEVELSASLGGWRTVFKRLGLIGQDAGRYGGFGFGNLSARDVERPDEFVISASQTGVLATLQDKHLVRITGYSLERFWVDATGTLPPSSETLTHAMIYAADPRISWVFHCHSPEIWQRAADLAIPCTETDVAYGSQQMVAAVAALLDKHQSRPLLFATLGHEDGVFCCGPTARDTGGLLVSYLAKTLSADAAR
jgi:ribulose-5-phosphate 4-epimerase/fuculose-1-phosphate aldolase